MDHEPLTVTRPPGLAAPSPVRFHLHLRARDMLKVSRRAAAGGRAARSIVALRRRDT